MGRREGHHRRRLGCGIAVLLAGSTVAVLISLAIVAHRQVQRATVTSETKKIESWEAAAPEALRRTLRLDLHTAELSLVPIVSGEPIVVDFDYDPEYYRATQETQRDEQTEVLVVRMVPSGSRLMAMLRAKMGGRLARLRIGVPQGVPVEIEGRLTATHAALEVGGLSLARLDLDVVGGTTRVSFAEPLAFPMDELSVLVDRGSLFLMQVGNGSPQRVRFMEHLGRAEIDLRGAWKNDAKVKINSGAAGGSLWLPEGVTILGLETRTPLIDRQQEATRPVLDVQLRRHVSRFVIIE